MKHDGSFVIEILNVRGNPNGIRFISRSNWDGDGAIVPRSMLGELQRDSDLKSKVDRAGVYILRSLFSNVTPHDLYW